MLVFNVFAFSYRCAVACSNALLNIVNCNVTVRISNSDEIFLLLSIGTTDDTVVCLDVKLREGRILQRVEAK